MHTFYFHPPYSKARLEVANALLLNIIAVTYERLKKDYARYSWEF